MVGINFTLCCRNNRALIPSSPSGTDDFPFRAETETLQKIIFQPLNDVSRKKSFAGEGEKLYKSTFKSMQIQIFCICHLKCRTIQKIIRQVSTNLRPSSLFSTLGKSYQVTRRNYKCCEFIMNLQCGWCDIGYG